MILGVGVDLVSYDRIGKIYSKYPVRFLNRIFTGSEIENIKNRGSTVAIMAARFAAKEAVLKAIGCGIGPAALKEVEIIAVPGAQPRARLYGEASRLAGERNIGDILISMSHESPFACAFATAVGSPDQTAPN